MRIRTVALVVVLAGLLGGCATENVGPVNSTVPVIDGHIPSQLRLSHDGESGWTRSVDNGVGSIFQPCPDRADPTVAGRIDAITAAGPGVPLRSAAVTAVLREQLLLFKDESAASAAMVALVKSKQECGWSETMVDWVAGYDSDVLVTDRFLGPPGSNGYVGRQQSTGRLDAFVLHRGPALWLTFAEVQGTVFPDTAFAAGTVDVRQELCTVMRLCYP